MIARMFITAALALSPCQLIAANCQAQPESPSCSKGEECAGPAAVEGGNNITFSIQGSTISICEAVMCLEGKMSVRRLAGNVEFVSGRVRKIDPETEKPGGPSYTLSAMLDRNTGIGHIAWNEHGIMMKCEI